MPKASIEQGVLTAYGRNPPVFDCKTPAVRTAEEIAQEYAKQRAPAELQNNYREFVRAPVKFIKDPKKFAGLVSIVSALTPEKFRQHEEEAEF